MMNKRLSLVLSLAALTGFSQTGMAVPSEGGHAQARAEVKAAVETHRASNPHIAGEHVGSGRVVSAVQATGNTDVRSDVSASRNARLQGAAGVDILTRDGKLSPSYTAALKAAPPKINVLGTSATKLTATQAQGLFGNTAEFVTGNMANSDSLVIAFGQSGVPYKTYSSLGLKKAAVEPSAVRDPINIIVEGKLTPQFNAAYAKAPKIINYNGTTLTRLSTKETTAFYRDSASFIASQPAAASKTICFGLGGVIYIF